MITDQPDTGTAAARERQAYEARTFARQAVHGLARELGAQATSRPMVRHGPDSPATAARSPTRRSTLPPVSRAATTPGPTAGRSRGLARPAGA
jgi:hypothetical protein